VLAWQDYLPPLSDGLCRLLEKHSGVPAC